MKRIALAILLVAGAVACSAQGSIMRGNGDPRRMSPVPNCAFGRFYVDEATQKMYIASQGSPCVWADASDVTGVQSVGPWGALQMADGLGAFLNSGCSSDGNGSITCPTFISNNPPGPDIYTLTNPPGTVAPGTLQCWADSTDFTFECKNEYNTIYKLGEGGGSGGSSTVGGAGAVQMSDGAGAHADSGCTSDGAGNETCASYATRGPGTSDIYTEVAAPGTPPSGSLYCWADSTDFTFECKNSSGAVYKLGTASAGQVQSDWTQADSAQVDYIKHKPTIPAAQVNSDWNAVSGVAQILNKPAIPPATSLTTTGTSGAATYNSTTGAMNIPQYAGSYTLPIATTTVLGGIKPDGTTITVDLVTGVASVSSPASAPFRPNFVIASGAAASLTGPLLMADGAGSLTKCRVIVKASDASTDLSFKIMRKTTGGSPADIFSTDPVVTHGAAQWSESTFTALTSSPLSVADGDAFGLTILTGTASWSATIQCQ